MSHEHNHEHEHRHLALHIGFEIGKLVLKGITAAAAICIAKSLYDVHRCIEAHHNK